MYIYCVVYIYLSTYLTNYPYHTHTIYSTVWDEQLEPGVGVEVGVGPILIVIAIILIMICHKNSGPLISMMYNHCK